MLILTVAVALADCPLNDLAAKLPRLDGAERPQDDADIELVQEGAEIEVNYWTMSWSNGGMPPYGTYTCQDGEWVEKVEKEAPPWDEGTHELRRHINGALSGISSTKPEDFDTDGDTMDDIIGFRVDQLLISNAGLSAPALLPYPRMTPHNQIGAEAPVRIVRKKHTHTPFDELWPLLGEDDSIEAWHYVGTALVYTVPDDVIFYEPLDCDSPLIHSHYEFQNQNVYMEVCSEITPEKVSITAVSYQDKLCITPGSSIGASEHFVSVSDAPIAEMHNYRGFVIHSRLERSRNPLGYMASSSASYPDHTFAPLSGNWVPAWHESRCP